MVAKFRFLRLTMERCAFRLRIMGRALRRFCCRRKTGLGLMTWFWGIQHSMATSVISRTSEALSDVLQEGLPTRR